MQTNHIILALLAALITSALGTSYSAKKLTFKGSISVQRSCTTVLTEKFENVSTLASNGWVGDYINQGYAVYWNVKSYDGGFFYFNYANAVNQSLFTPVLDLTNGLFFSFYTETDSANVHYPDL